MYLPSRTGGGDDDSDMQDVYDGAENNFSYNDIGAQKLEIRSNSTAKHHTQPGDDYRSDENTNYQNNNKVGMMLDSQTIDPDVIAYGSKPATQGTKLPPFR